MTEGRASLTGWPVNLLVEGRKVVVVGAGRIAARKTAPLVELGAVVTVVAPEICDEVRAMNVTLIERAFEAADLDDAWFVVTATDVPAVNEAVFEAAEARRMFCNSADDPANCSATLLALVRQGDLVVAIGSGGRSPALATWLRQHVQSEMGPEYLTLVELLSEEREAMRAAGHSSEDANWQNAFASGIVELVKAGQIEEAREVLRTCL